MTLDPFFDSIRLILGDRQVQGLWNYDELTLSSAVRSVFLLGRNPLGYTLSSDLAFITPDVASGNDFALITYDAALLLIGGEDGALSYRTRALSVTDAGHRKRDLLLELRNLIGQIRDGLAVFETSQSFVAFIGNASAAGDTILGPIAEFSTMELNAGIQHISI